MIYLDEKDLQSKLSLLFKKNLYDVAIRIASSQHYDQEGLTEIYKQYGDHLYSKVCFYFIYGELYMYRCITIYSQVFISSNRHVVKNNN